MKIVVLDGFAANPGDLSWEGMKVLGECTIYDRTAPEEVLERAAGAEAILTNKVIINADHMAALPELKYIGVLATGYNVVDTAAAKEGIRGLTRVAANEWAKDGINVNVVCPLAWTAQLEQFEKAYPEAFKANVKTPPMGHFGNNELEIGRVCVQLANPDFKYMTGETLTLEGGLGLRP